MGDLSEKSRLHKDVTDIIDCDLPRVKITKETKRVMVESASSGRFLINDVRVANGTFYTDEEYENFRREVLSKPLPGASYFERIACYLKRLFH